MRTRRAVRAQTIHSPNSGWRCWSAPSRGLARCRRQRWLQPLGERAEYSTGLSAYHHQFLRDGARAGFCRSGRRGCNVATDFLLRGLRKVFETAGHRLRKRLCLTRTRFQDRDNGRDNNGRLRRPDIWSPTSWRGKKGAMQPRQLTRLARGGQVRTLACGMGSALNLWAETGA